MPGKAAACTAPERALQLPHTGGVEPLEHGVRAGAGPSGRVRSSQPPPGCCRAATPSRAASVQPAGEGLRGHRDVHLPFPAPQRQSRRAAAATAHRGAEPKTQRRRALQPRRPPLAGPAPGPERSDAPTRRGRRAWAGREPAAPPPRGPLGAGRRPLSTPVCWVRKVCGEPRRSASRTRAPAFATHHAFRLRRRTARTGRLPGGTNWCLPAANQVGAPMRRSASRSFSGQLLASW